MNANLSEFLKLAGADTVWFDQFKAAPSRDVAIELCLAKAQELGVKLTASDFPAIENELSEDELASVAGGGICLCEIVGGGTADEEKYRNGGCLDEVCACVIGGYGSYDEDGDSKTRCVCAQLGSGASYR